MPDIQNYLKESRDREVETTLESILKDLTEEGLSVEFGKIGERTTYALIHNADNSIEIVGYTFLKDMRFYRDNVGKLRALQQALARKQIAENKK